MCAFCAVNGMSNTFPRVYTAIFGLVRPRAIYMKDTRKYGIISCKTDVIADMRYSRYQEVPIDSCSSEASE